MRLSTTAAASDGTDRGGVQGRGLINFDEPRLG